MTASSKRPGDPSGASARGKRAKRDEDSFSAVRPWLLNHAYWAGDMQAESDDDKKARGILAAKASWTMTRERCLCF